VAGAVVLAGLVGLLEGVERGGLGRVRASGPEFGVRTEFQRLRYGDDVTASPGGGHGAGGGEGGLGVVAEE
jgi:hypothetical protein